MVRVLSNALGTAVAGECGNLNSSVNASGGRRLPFERFGHGLERGASGIFLVPGHANYGSDLKAKVIAYPYPPGSRCGCLLQPWTFRPFPDILLAVSQIGTAGAGRILLTYVVEQLGMGIWASTCSKARR